MRAGDKILHVMVQTNQNNSGGMANGGMANGGMANGLHMSGRSHSGMDASGAANSMAAAMLAAAAGQQGMLAPQPDWPLLPPAAAGAMMW